MAVKIDAGFDSRVLPRAHASTAYATGPLIRKELCKKLSLGLYKTGGNNTSSRRRSTYAPIGNCHLLTAYYLVLLLCCYLLGRTRLRTTAFNGRCVLNCWRSAGPVLEYHVHWYYEVRWVFISRRTTAIRRWGAF